MSLLDVILSDSAKQLAKRQRDVPLGEVQKRAADAPRAAVDFRLALEVAPFSIIAEVKAASPSSGAMDPANVRIAVGPCLTPVQARGLFHPRGLDSLALRHQEPRLGSTCAGDAERCDV